MSKVPPSTPRRPIAPTVVDAAPLPTPAGAAGQARDGSSDTTTRGVRVVVKPRFMPERSTPKALPAERKWVFAYHITVTNQTESAVQLLARRWHIVDANGEAHDVEGEGVVGRTPVIPAGQSFEYESFCPLGTAWGTMEGSYKMRRGDGEIFEAVVGRFFLVAGK